METGQEVQELSAGEDYLLSSSSLYAMSTSEAYDADSKTKAMSYCHITPQRSEEGILKAVLSPLLAGTLYFQNEDGIERSYPITEGTKIQTASMNIELGGAVPPGFIESYETIYNRQYLYQVEKNPEHLILIGAENERVQTVFLMEPYQINTENAYLEVTQTAFGGTTIQPIRYYSDKLLEGRLNSSISLLRNESTLANIVANAIRAGNGLCDLIEKEDLTKKAEEQAIRVSTYNGNSSYWHNLGGNPGQRYGNCGYQSVNENITKGGMGSAHCVAVAAIDAYYTSPGHRQNLLAPSHAYIGTGIVYHGADSFTITQAYAK
ncbi:CAP domain-containing protein [Zhenpiania hominis]|uniref:CAP domain-containing protein n=1 Tax=Zhenpiania hominis TaxID=2763644 RepID=A0A923NLU5_9FIRM|nr:CAP domain-containing protein [Zhenpiania hominis]MBC6679547.1 CAP domain-containing protein [Zhenpiania hominis]